MVLFMIRCSFWILRIFDSLTKQSVSSSWRVEATVIQLFLASVISWFLPNRSCNGSWIHRWGCKGVCYGKKRKQVTTNSSFDVMAEVNITSLNRVHSVILPCGQINHPTRSFKTIFHSLFNKSSLFRGSKWELDQYINWNFRSFKNILVYVRKFAHIFYAVFYSVVKNIRVRDAVEILINSLVRWRGCSIFE